MSALANVLVVAEHDHGTLKPATLNTVTAAVEVLRVAGLRVPWSCSATTNTFASADI